MNLDPRLNAFRPDLADAALEGKVEAARFVRGRLARISAPQAPVRREPSADSMQVTEALGGEAVTVFETQGDFAWVQLTADRYVGWLPKDSLAKQSAEPTHKVSVQRTLVFSKPNIKSALIATRPLGAKVAVTGEAEDRNARYALIAPAGAVVAQHLARLDVFEDDWASVAERFVGAPYLWGGRTNMGIDCSGLIQISLLTCGITAPRDADMQETAVGTPLSVGDGLPQLRRGDLVFWKGHAGIMLDGYTLLHANAHHMAVAAEPLEAAMARFAPRGLAVTSIRRIAPR